jgi:hypothetical protein
MRWIGTEILKKIYLNLSYDRDISQQFLETLVFRRAGAGDAGHRLDPAFLLPEAVHDLDDRPA